MRAHVLTDEPAWRIVPASTPEDMASTREIFREYQQALGVDLCFQGFEAELATLPGKYAPPDGRLFLAKRGDALAGSIALRRLDGESGEVKRLYVRPAYRGLGLGPEGDGEGKVPVYLTHPVGERRENGSLRDTPGNLEGEQIRGERV